ncbi:hypothetical protein NYQ35_15990 [Curtobacterium flaccumfaciens pv. flaccumfaciens]|uniref:hypothetical protein n=1 Tax=Curtobacterium flaccumfaciens TaxID=2035 RepID=UPI00217E0EA3|nr:hypothetical protein [Curtobacterium flaccumfaciens]MCS6570307.1 hypothetical protein [Curtobacterium flaccumfaciens pv. flaccumfaciens]MCS6585163.1 hypothetical protein [Curtobacterium flaccumfaciens pv. flaccumfaciens]
MTAPLSVRGRDERRRQQTEEYRTPSADLGKSAELLLAAGCYSLAALDIDRGRKLGGLTPFEYHQSGPPEGWPWADRYWKPTAEPARMREKAYGLLLAAQEALEKEDDTSGERRGKEQP